jgi:ABC-2 type transport system ATP-binding protein
MTDTDSPSEEDGTVSPAVQLEGLTRTFGTVTAVNDISLAIERGDIYGMLGPNGAGKTTLISVLLNFIKPTSGTARVFGFNVQRDELEVAWRTGVLPEGFTPYPELTGREHVAFVCGVRDSDTPPIQYLESVGLADDADRKAGGYSRGMTRRLGLAMALVADPPLLILDEPFAGLDPTSAGNVQSLVEERAAGGTTILFSSHQLAHVEALCDRVGILSDGRLIEERSIGSTETFSCTTRRPPDSVPSTVRSLDGVRTANVVDGRLVFETVPEIDHGTIVNTLSDAGFGIQKLDTAGRSLQTVYENAMSKAAQEE